MNAPCLYCLTRSHMKSLLAIFLVSLFAIGCSSDSDESARSGTTTAPIYNAKIVRTQFGIPHITADDLPSIGYGFGYAVAQDNFCVLMREIIVAQGESARYFEEAVDFADEEEFNEDAYLENDFVWKYFNSDELINEWVSSQPDDIIQGGTGYVAGVNRYLEETGVANLANGDEGCRNAPWVRPITKMDMYKLLRKLTLYASTQQFVSAINAAQPAVGNVAKSKTGSGGQLKSASDEQLLATLQNLQLDILPDTTEMGSNAYALGANVTQSGRGILLGNPHFPWQGSQRFSMAHLHIPGQYNVFGAALIGIPIINIGFNKNVAWSHTVSTARRFALFELSLAPDNALQYIYDGETRDITSTTVSAEEKLANGDIVNREKTLYFSHLGPIVDIGVLNDALVLFGGWPALGNKAYVLHDANLHNSRGLEYWYDMGKSENIAQLKTAQNHVGNPWTNTIAADREGTAFYGDMSVTPHISDALVDSCANSLVAGALLSNRLFMLDGSTSDCQLGSDADAPEAGIFAASSLPSITTRDYAANANGSYWLSNPEQLLTGFPLVIGAENIAQTMRTRLTFVQAQERIAGTDGLGEAKFSVDNLQDVIYGSRNMPAELMLDDFIPLCDAVTDWSPYTTNTGAAEQACNILAAWDKTSNIDSVGTHIFQEFWFSVIDDTLLDGDAMWSVAFDPADPVNTPNTLKIADPIIQAALLSALANAVDILLENNILLDSPWGDVQYSPRNGENIPIHGASGSSSFSVITSELIADQGYTDIRHGNSYMQTVTWDDSDCPDAFALLSYSMSTDPESAHYADITRAYSEKQWIDVPYCDADIEATKISEISLSTQ